MPARFLLLCFTLLFCSCGETARVGIVFEPVVAREIAAIEKVLPPTPPIPAPDFEFSSRVRARVASLAGDPGPMHALLALSASDFGDAAVPVLAQVLGEANLGANMRVAAAEMLAALDSPDAAAVLVYHATSNPVRWLRAQCAWRLASTTQDQCVPALLDAVAVEQDAETRTFLSSTLAHFGCSKFGANEVQNPPSKRFELQVWQRFSALRSMASTSRSAPELEAAIATLGALPPAFAKHCAEALHDENELVRAAAARAVERMGLEASVAGPALLESLLADPSIEAEAIAALGAVHYTPGVGAIVERLADGSRSLAVRTSAASALAALESPLAVATLMRATEPHEPLLLRIAAADALCSLGRADSAVPILTEALASDGPTSARAAAALDRWLARLAREGNAKAQSIVDLREKSALAPAQFAELLKTGAQELLR